jgi:hypothetical protein
MKKEITICEKCGTPLIWTFRWDYKEMYCLNCGAMGDMFMGKKVETTPELKLKFKAVNKVWKSLYGKNRPLLPASGGYRKNNCKKCDAGENHSKHLSKKEIRENKVAEKILIRIKGLF